MSWGRYRICRVGTPATLSLGVRVGLEKVAIEHHRVNDYVLGYV